MDLIYVWIRFNLVKARFIRNNQLVSYHVKSTIWSGIRHCFVSALEGNRWCIGDVTNINFWIHWLSKPLGEEFDIPRHLHSRLNAKY